MDDLTPAHVEHNLFALGRFVKRVSEDGLHGDPTVCCPNVRASQLHNILSSIMYTCCTLEEDLFLGLVDALYHNVGATFCRDGRCGVKDCTFHTVEWDSRTAVDTPNLYVLPDGRTEFPLVTQLRGLLVLRRDRTILTVLRTELADKHRRAIANFIALVKPDHLFAHLLNDSELWVQAVTEGTRKDGHTRYITVVTDAACATSVKSSRFQDYNDFADTSKSVGANVNQLWHQSQELYLKCDAKEDTAGGGTETPCKPVIKKVFAASDAAFDPKTPDYSYRIVEALRNATFCVGNSGAVLPPGRYLYFAPDRRLQEVRGLDSHPRYLFNVVHSVRYMPGIRGEEAICGGGIESIPRQIQVAKRPARFGPLDMRSNGDVIGWESLPTHEQVEHVFRTKGGSRSYNAWVGPMALEKCHEFGLPYVDKDPCSVTMADHERDARAHSFVQHTAFLTRPRLLVWFRHDEPTPIWLEQTHVDRLVRIVQTVGVGMHRALARFRRKDDDGRRAKLRKAFAYCLTFAQDCSVVQLASRATLAHLNCEAVIAARIATLTYANTSTEWESMYDELAPATCKVQLEEASDFLLKASYSARARATLILFGLWFDVDAIGAPWPGPRQVRARPPFDPREMCDIGTLKFQCPSTGGVKVGYMNALEHTHNGFALEMEGHTPVSLTHGHLIVLEEAVRFVRNAPSVRIDAAADVAWDAVLPAPTMHTPTQGVPTVFRGHIIANAMFRNRANVLRAWVGFISLRTATGEVCKLTYRSVLIENSDDRKRKRSEHEVAGFGLNRFPDVFGLDHSRRLVSAGGLPGLVRGDEVVLTAYFRKNPDFVEDTEMRFEVTHAILISHTDAMEEEAEADDHGPGELAEPLEPLTTYGLPARVRGELQPLSPKSSHGRAIAPIFQLTTDARSPILDGLNACIAFYSFPLQRNTKANAGLIQQGDAGAGKSTNTELIGGYIYGANIVRYVKKLGTEVDRAFTQEFQGTQLVIGDDVGESFIKACEGSVMKEILTHDTIKGEKKHVQQLTSSENNLTMIASTNERRLLKKLDRRWGVVFCANGLCRRAGGDAAALYHVEVRGPWSNPWSNAGILCFLDTFPLVASLETYTGCKSATMAALSDAPSEFHLRFLKWLAELPIAETDVTPAEDVHRTAINDDRLALEFEECGWGEQMDMDASKVKSLIDSWFKHVCARREHNITGTATTIMQNFAKLVKADVELLNMNANSKDTRTYHLTRRHISRSLEAQGYRVEPHVHEFYSAEGWKALGFEGACMLDSAPSESASEERASEE